MLISNARDHEKPQTSNPTPAQPGPFRQAVPRSSRRGPGKSSLWRSERTAANGGRDPAGAGRGRHRAVGRVPERGQSFAADAGTSISAVRAKLHTRTVLIRICFSLLMGLKRLLKFKCLFTLNYERVCIHSLCTPI